MEKNGRLSKQMKTEKVLGYLAAAGTIGILMLFLAIFFDYYYCMNDDTVMRDLLCGSYTGTPEGRNIQMLYPVGALISLFYRIFPKVPWYGLFLCGCQFLSLYLISFRATKFADASWKKIAAAFIAVFLAGGTLLCELVFVQYTMTCSLLMAAAVFWFYTGDSFNNAAGFIKANGISIGLVVLAFLIRTEMALLLFPFLLAAGLYKWAGEEKIFTKVNCVKYLGVIGSAVLCMGASVLINKAAYGSEEWKDFYRFFDARTEVYDFLGYPNFEGNEEFYEEAGLTAQEAELLANYNFALDEKIDVELMERTAAYQKEKRGGNALFLTKPADALWIYRHSLLSREFMPYNALVLFLYVLILFAAIGNKDKSYFWRLPLLLFIRSVCWMYIIFRNRMPERITHGLFLMETVLLFALLVGEWKKKKAGWLTVMAIVCIIVALNLPAVWNKAETEKAYRNEVNREWLALTDHFKENQDNFYLIDVYSTVDYTEKMFADVDHSYRNFDLCGGWTAKSPVYRQKAAKRGVGDIEKDLVEKDHVFFVSKMNRDVVWLEEYYAAKGREIKIEAAEEIVVNGEVRFVIYRLL